MPQRTREQLLESFDEQIEFLERSNDSFDEGHHSEAKRLAVTLRVLFRMWLPTPSDDYRSAP